MNTTVKINAATLAAGAATAVQKVALDDAIRKLFIETKFSIAAQSADPTKRSFLRLSYIVATENSTLTVAQILAAYRGDVKVCEFPFNPETLANKFDTCVRVDGSFLYYWYENAGLAITSLTSTVTELLVAQPA